MIYCSKFILTIPRAPGRQRGSPKTQISASCKVAEFLYEYSVTKNILKSIKQPLIIKHPTTKNQLKPPTTTQNYPEAPTSSQNYPATTHNQPKSPTTSHNYPKQAKTRHSHPKLITNTQSHPKPSKTDHYCQNNLKSPTTT